MIGKLGKGLAALASDHSCLLLILALGKVQGKSKVTGGLEGGIDSSLCMSIVSYDA